MTAKPHTPTATQIREDYAHLRYHFADGWSIGEERVQFDNWLAAEIAAAEQRGAVMVMDVLKRESSDSSWEGIVQPGRSLQELVDHIEHGIRADQEGDDG